jgi:Tfp pilus assembly protein PilF
LQLDRQSALAQLKTCLEEGMQAYVRLDLSQAKERFAGALAIAPRHPVALSYLGLCHWRTGDPQRAETLLRQGVEAGGRIPDLHNNLGMYLHQQTRFAEAEEAFRQALALRPDFLEALNNLGLNLLQMRKLGEAKEALLRALRLNPDAPAVRTTLGALLLLEGNLEQGWKEYEHRLLGNLRHAWESDSANPQWRGEALQGRRILLRNEQGMGDAIQFMRYATVLSRFGAIVDMALPPELEGLGATLAGVHRIVPSGATHPGYDFECSMTSLPHYCGTRLETIPAEVP